MEAAIMTLIRLRAIATEMLVLCGSGLFLGWYLWVKVAVWPWGAWSF
jgi:hypothetical protein